MAGGAVGEVQGLANKAVDAAVGIGNIAVDLGVDEFGLAFEAVAKVFRAFGDAAEALSKAAVGK